MVVRMTEKSLHTGISKLLSILVVCTLLLSVPIVLATDGSAGSPPKDGVHGEDVTVDEGDRVTLDGSVSTDNVGISRYTWSPVYEGEELGFHSPISDFAFTFDQPCVHTVTLNVVDAEDQAANDMITVTVLDETAPVADAGMDVVVDQHLAVIFDGSQSTDNVGIVRWTWIFDHLGAEIRLEGMTPVFIFTEAGVYTVTLEVADPTGLTDTDTMTVTVMDVDAPKAKAGLNKTVFEGTKATFDGSGSEDNVAVVSWTWKFVHMGSQVTLEGETATFVFEQTGDYDVRLTVADAAGNSDSATMVVTVETMPPPPNGDGDPDWSQSALYGGLAAVIVIAVLIALLLIRRRY